MEKWFQVKKVQLSPLEDLNESDESLDFQQFDIDIEALILSLTDRKETEVLIFKVLGFKYKEIAPLINSNVSEYYSIFRSLKRNVKDRLKDRLD